MLVLPVVTATACAEGDAGPPCALPGEEAEVVVCEGGAVDLVADVTSLYWISGLDLSGVLTTITCELNNCGPPALYSLGHDGGNPEEIAALEGTPRGLGIGPTIIVSTMTGLWEIGYRGGIHALDPTSSFAIVGGHLWRSSGHDIVRDILPTTVSPPAHTVLTDDEPVVALAASDEFLVWTTYVHPEDESWSPRTIFAKRIDDLDGEAFSIADDLWLVFDLAIDGHHVVWRDLSERVWSRDLRTDAPAIRLAEHVTAFAVHDGVLYHGTRDHNQIALHHVPLSGGPATTLIAYESEISRTILSITVHDGHVYWSDARIMRKPLD